MKTEQGMVLITTLIMLAVLALFVISQMQAVFLVVQSLNQLQAKHQVFYQLEAAAHKILAQSWPIPTNCSLPVQDPQDVVFLLKKHQGCQFWYEQQLYWYWLEDLGLFPCLQTRLQDRIYSTHHVRLSLLTNEAIPTLLQLRIAKPAPLATCENQAPNLIKTGIISWRQ